MSAHSGSGSQRYLWYATINNFTQEDIEKLQAIDAKELVIGKEEAPTTGTPHLHVYLNLRQKKRLAQMKAVSERAHWEPVISRQQCIEYCQKGHEVLVANIMHQASHQVHELDSAICTLQERGLSAVAEEYPRQFVLHQKGLQALQAQQIAQRDKPIPNVSWFYGNTGTGKTRLAFDYPDKDNLYFIPRPPKKDTPMWFDGYCGQKRVVIDDFRPYQCSFSFLLNLLDRYPMLVPVKGGHVNWIPEEIIITAPIPPEEMFTGAYHTDEDLRQLARRIHRRVRFVSFNAPTATFSLSRDAVCAYSPTGQLVSMEANQSPPERFPLPSGIPLVPEQPPDFSCHSTQSESEC